MTLGASTASSAATMGASSASLAAVFAWTTDRVVEAIDDQAGQAVGFGVDQPVERLGIQPLAQGQGATEPVCEKALVDDGRAVAVEQAEGDQRVRVEAADAERLAVDPMQARKRPRRQSLGLGVHADLVGVGPGMAMDDALVAAGKQVDAGKRRRRRGHERDRMRRGSVADDTADMLGRRPGAGAPLVDRAGMPLNRPRPAPYSNAPAKEDSMRSLPPQRDALAPGVGRAFQPAAGQRDGVEAAFELAHVDLVAQRLKFGP